MSTATEAWNTELLGVYGDPIDFEVERDRIIAYAEATNDPIEQHRSGDVAPPVFAVVPAIPALGAAGFAVIPPDLMMSVLHGKQDFHFHRPIEPGMKLVTRGAPIGWQQRSSGVTLVARSETHTSDGELLNEQLWTIFVRRAECPGDQGQAAPPHEFDEALRSSAPIAEVVQRFDADQTFRYSEASGDLMPVHLDDEVARAVGLPGIIIHGLCTMAFTSHAVITNVCPDDPTRLKRLAVRFSKVCFPEEEITTSIWRAEEADGREAYAFETVNSEGQAVIKDGRAELG